jgi:hypothetical protein
MRALGCNRRRPAGRIGRSSVGANVGAVLHEERQILSAIMVAAEIGSAFFTTPGVPADRLTALRRAFDATMANKEFLADVERTKLAVLPMKGEDLQQLVKQVSDLSPTMLEKVRHAYTANQYQ